MGNFNYWKRLKDTFVQVNVSVYPLHVERQLKKWKERGERKRAWLKPQQAAVLVDEPALVSLLDSIAVLSLNHFTPHGAPRVSCASHWRRPRISRVTSRGNFQR